MASPHSNLKKIRKPPLLFPEMSHNSNNISAYNNISNTSKLNESMTSSVDAGKENNKSFNFYAGYARNAAAANNPKKLSSYLPSNLSNEANETSASAANDPPFSFHSRVPFKSSSKNFCVSFSTL